MRLRTVILGLGKAGQKHRAEGESQRSAVTSRHSGAGSMNGVPSPLVQNSVVTRGTANSVRAASGSGGRNRRL